VVEALNKGDTTVIEKELKKREDLENKKKLH
jgi:hypothetical protein